jgi:mannobiose 2-epimerase
MGLLQRILATPRIGITLPDMVQSPSSTQELRLRADQELCGDILPFWAKNAFNPTTGRIAGLISHDLRIFDDVPRHAVICARLLWTFAAAQRQRPSQAWLDTGEKARALLTGAFWDKINGGIFWSLAPNRSVLSPRKQIYAEAFAIYGLSEWSMATGDKTALNQAISLFELIEQHAADPVHGGYIEALGQDWSPLEDMRLSDKDLNAPKSMNTLLHILEAYTNLLLVWPDAQLKKKLRALLLVMLDRVVSSEPYTRCALFFDMEWHSQNEVISFGHDIEASWLLWDAAKLLGDEALEKRTRRVALDMAAGVLAHGIDADGAVLYSGTARGILNAEKHWWPQAEGVVGFLNAYELSGDETYLKAALKTWSFIENKVVDPVHGEWFAVLDRSGTPLPDYPAFADSCKIGPWKCPYHNARVCIEVLKRCAS